MRMREYVIVRDGMIVWEIRTSSFKKTQDYVKRRTEARDDGTPAQYEVYRKVKRRKWLWYTGRWINPRSKIS